MKTISAILVVAAIAGCAAPTPSRPPLQMPHSAAEVAAAVSVTDTRFDASVKYVGPLMFTAAELPDPSVADREGWVLRSWRDRKSGALTHQLYVTIVHRDRSSRQYRTASFADATSVDAARIAYEPNCRLHGNCIHTETVGVEIADSRLRAARHDGMQVRLNSRAGVQNVLTLPAYYIDGYLLAVDK